MFPSTRHHSCAFGRLLILVHVHGAGSLHRRPTRAKHEAVLSESIGKSDVVHECDQSSHMASQCLACT